MTTPSTSSSSSRNNGASSSDQRTLPQRLHLVLDPEFSNSDLEKQKPAILCLVHNMEQFFTVQDNPIEHFKEMVSILHRIFLRWPQSRCWLLDDTQLLSSLHTALSNKKDLLEPILQLYSSLALCGYWAEKLLQNCEVLQIVVESMSDENNDSVRLEAFRLVQCLAMTKNGCNKMITEYGEPIVKAIVSVLTLAKEIKGNQNHTSILEEACHLALITRWEGRHHLYFWEAGVARAIFFLLLSNSAKFPMIESLPPDMTDIHRPLIDLVENALIRSRFYSLTPHLWDILGWLATNCADDFDQTEHENELHVNMVILCACISFAELIETERKVPEVSLTNKNVNISSARAVFMILNSPSRHIASTASYFLCRVLKTNSQDDSDYKLKSLATCSRSRFSVPNSIRLVIKLMNLACRSSILEYQGHIIQKNGFIVVLDFIRWWLINPIRIKRPEVAKHLGNCFTVQCCCLLSLRNSEEIGDWEGDDIILLCSLYTLDKLLDLLGQGVFNDQTRYSEANVVSLLQSVDTQTSAHGPKWYASYILRRFGHYGFLPNEIGKRMWLARARKRFTDLEVEFENRRPINVHSFLLMVRCPSLISSIKQYAQEKASGGSPKFLLPGFVNQKLLTKFLEYVYLGYVQATKDLGQRLRIVAGNCGLDQFFPLLCRSNPKWGTPMPNFDLTPALSLGGLHFWDIVVKSETEELENWVCNSCSSRVPHLHAQKVLLESSCDHLKTMFGSGCKESYSKIIKFPISWLSLQKLANWIYTGWLPKPTFDCRWHYFDEFKLEEIRSYIELVWLGDYWLIQSLYQESYMIAVSCLELSCLEFSRPVYDRIIQIACDFGQLKLANEFKRIYNEQN